MQSVLTKYKYLRNTVIHRLVVDKSKESEKERKREEGREEERGKEREGGREGRAKKRR